MAQPEYKPILFTYDPSVFGRRVDWYLTLRGFRYAQCQQPNRMPRPDLEALGVAYRRIPIMAIGRDIYCDSRLIIDKLEKRFPENPLGSTNTYEQGLETILQTWVIDGGPFWRTASLIPPDTGLMLDKSWTDDRSSMTGRNFNRQTMAAARPDGYVHVRNNFETIEHGLLADGRKFVFATDKPTLIDIHTIWPFDWAIGMPQRMGEHLDPDIISGFHFPKVYAWVQRFRQAVDEAQEKTGPPEQLSSEDTIQQILQSDFWEKEQTVDELDPLRLKKGQKVKVYPTDSGSNCQDIGRLVSLCKTEVVIESEVKNGGGLVRVHFPRLNFKIEAINEEDGNSDGHGAAAAA